jgi:hypothetical protein
MRSAADNLGGSGFSLVEVLLAMLIFTTGALPILGMTLQAMGQISRSSTLREMTRRAEERLEQLADLPLESPLLRVPEGAEELVTLEWWSPKEKRWVERGSEFRGAEYSFSGRVRVRQFAVDALYEGETFLEEAERLSGGGRRSLAHLKEIEVKVWLDVGPGRGGRMLPQVSLRTVRAF